MGATLATTKAAAVMTPGTHGSTFGGNPLAMAVANAVLDVVLADGFMENVISTGKSLYEAMSALTVKYPNLFTEARGVGMHLGLRCNDSVVNNDLVIRVLENGLLVVPAGDNVIRMIPPMTITEEHVSEAISVMETTCAQMIKEGVGQ